MVKGYGDGELGIAFVGEAPGQTEVEEGRPFVGKAGKMLTDILKALKIRRKKCHITNTILCRPKDNANPQPDAILRCRKRLWRELTGGNFKLIVCLGRFASSAIMGPDFKWGRFRYIPTLGEDVVAVGVYHPMYYCYRGDDLDGAIREYSVIKKWLKHRDVFERKPDDRSKDNRKKSKKSS